jgi:hypothetical protein
VAWFPDVPRPPKGGGGKSHEKGPSGLGILRCRELAGIADQVGMSLLDVTFPIVPHAPK